MTTKELREWYFDLWSVAGKTPGQFSSYPANYINKAQKCVDFVHKEVYEGNQTITKVIEHYNMTDKQIKQLEKTNWAFDTIEELGFDVNEMKKYVNDITPEVSANIDRIWEEKSPIIENYFNKIFNIKI